MTLLGTRWVRWALLAIATLVLLSPVFGVAAEAVGYAEPMENAAEATGAAEHATSLAPALFPDYSAPGASGPIGTLVAGAVGTALVLIASLGLGKSLS